MFVSSRWKLPSARLRPGAHFRRAAMEILSSVLWWWGLASAAGTAWVILWAFCNWRAAERDL